VRYGVKRMTTRRDRVSITCPVCREPIAADDPVVQARGRQPIHVRCWRLDGATEEAEDKREEGGAA